jgi:hypothetical protein
MRIAQINLPVLDNNGAGMVHVHEKLQRDLCTIFGGYTVTEAQGAWMDKGKLYAEPVMVYQVAYEPNASERQKIRMVADRAGKAAKQIAMFVVLDGEAEIVEIE